MDAKELRIGNIIKGNFTNEDYDDNENVIEIKSSTICEVICLDSTGQSESIILVDSKDNIEDFDYFEGIELTEKWLLKFGFKKKLGNYELDNFRFHINRPFNYDGFLFCEGYSVITDKIKFLHQLQNLYFSLTGEELNSKTN